MVFNRSNGVYRSVIVAIAGLILIAASPPKDSGGGDNTKSAQNIEKALNGIAATVDKTVQPTNDDKGCQQGMDDRRSDLCAQWKAADAAEESADYAARSFWASLVVAIFALAALIYTARGTRAAIEAVDAQVVSDRPILQLSRYIVSEQDPAGFKVSRKINVHWFITNYGATGCWVEKFCISTWAFEANDERHRENSSIAINAFVPPGKEVGNSTHAMTCQFTDEDEFSAFVASRQLHITGYSIYRDAGGRRWKTGFAGQIILEESFTGSDLTFGAEDKYWSDERIANVKRRWWDRQKHADNEGTNHYAPPLGGIL
jgi:hypothetical protein